jgi:hypothetical protein
MAFRRRRAPQQRREILAVDVLHRKKRVAVHFIDVVDAADVGMRYLPRHPHFRVQLREAHWIAIDLGRKKLQRHLLTELQVVGAKDLAHSALAQLADNAVSLTQHGAGREAAVIDGGRGEPSGRAVRLRGCARRRCRGCKGRIVGQRLARREPRFVSPTVRRRIR